MAATNQSVREGPFPGSRCLAAPDGSWAPATVRRVNEDGTFKVELDVKQMTVLPDWFGVTPAEVSFNDAEQWPGVFARLSGGRPALSRTDVKAGFATSFGHAIDDGRFEDFWTRSCLELLGVAEVDAARQTLDERTAYELFRDAGLSAKPCAAALDGTPLQRFYKLYWNQIRMGGREPTELARTPTLADAIAALGLSVAAVDDAARGRLSSFEAREGVVLPTKLKNLMSLRGVADAVLACHSNGPTLVYPDEDRWEFHRGVRASGVNGDCAVTVLMPHQGDHAWEAVFDAGDGDARVYVRWHDGERDRWNLTAATVGMFYWDLAQTGLSWYEDTKFRGGKRVRRTDIGLVLDR